MLQLNGRVSFMPTHIKTRVFCVIPHSASLGYLIYNFVTCFIIIPIINLLKPQALGHWCVIYFTFLSQDAVHTNGVTSDCYFCSRLTMRVTQPLIVQTRNMFP